MPTDGNTRHNIRVATPIWAAGIARADREFGQTGERLSTLLTRVVREYAAGATVIRLGAVLTDEEKAQ